MTVKATASALKTAADPQKRVVNNDAQQTPVTKRKPAKSERASTLCATPPTCIKDKDCHVEYTRNELLGEADSSWNVLMVGRLCAVLFSYQSPQSAVRSQGRREGISQNAESEGKSIDTSGSC